MQERIRGERKKDGMKQHQTKNEESEAAVSRMPLCVSVFFCSLTERGRGRVGRRLMWFSLRPPEAWSSERSRLIGEERDGGRKEGREEDVVYLDMLYSVFNARITIKMLRLISYVYKTV